MLQRLVWLFVIEYNNLLLGGEEPGTAAAAEEVEVDEGDGEGDGKDE